MPQTTLFVSSSVLTLLAGSPVDCATPFVCSWLRQFAPSHVPWPLARPGWISRAASCPDRCRLSSQLDRWTHLQAFAAQRPLLLASKAQLLALTRTALSTVLFFSCTILFFQDSSPCLFSAKLYRAGKICQSSDFPFLWCSKHKCASCRLLCCIDRSKSWNKSSSDISVLIDQVLCNKASNTFYLAEASFGLLQPEWLDPKCR